MIRQRLLTGKLPFIGRTTLLEELRTFWQETDQYPEPQIIVLEGPAGTGKTRLVSELIKNHIDYGALIHVSLFAMCNNCKELLANAIQTAFVTARLKDPGTLETYEAIYQALAQLTRTRVTLIIFEDVHKATPESLREITSLFDMLSSTRLSILCTTHPIDRGWTAPFRRYIMREETLEGFNRYEVEQLWEKTFELTAPAELITSLWQQSHGNPMALTRIFRMLVQDGLLRQNNGSAEWKLHGNVEQLLTAISKEIDLLGSGLLKELPTDLRSAAEWIAVHGEIVPVDICERLPKQP